MGENVAGYGYCGIGTSAATILVLFILLVIILSVF
ncbi:MULTISPECIES: sporulation protein YjcZ [unclassified Paenibacillus]|nr:sporulation protein YjcZ [Paenibacillus sp. IHB B 3415]